MSSKTFALGRIEGVENQAAAKAQIVKALKAMMLSLQHGEQVTTILDKSQVWKEYKDQKHDLFIANTPIAGYLTGGMSTLYSHKVCSPRPGRSCLRSCNCLQLLTQLQLLSTTANAMSSSTATASHIKPTTASATANDWFQPGTTASTTATAALK